MADLLQEKKVQTLPRNDLPDREPTKELRAARRLLEDMPGYERLGDFSWEERLEKWVLHIRMTIDVPESEYMPTVTEWRVIIDPQYPLGQICFMPDENKGIKHTFQHQNNNRLLNNSKWRSGKICLDTGQGTWGRKKYSPEPVDTINRLKWHVERCLIWLEAAATDTLIENGDPFELPDFPTSTDYRIAFNEDNDSFVRWQSEQRSSGFFNYKPLDQQPETYNISRFDVFSEEVAAKVWGSYINDRNKYAKNRNKEKAGLWLMLKHIPVMKPWQIPATFKELDAVCQAQGINLLQILLKTYLRSKREKIKLDLVALGFPVPVRIGSPEELIHWFAFKLILPKLNGFRDNEVLWKQQFTELISGTAKIQWIKTENWNSMQLTNRGRISEDLTNSRILFIGAGALGATFAELFGRLGCSNLTFVDYDKVHAGNLSRHTLTLNDVGKNKAEALSAHINSVFPFHRCKFRKNGLEDILSKETAFLDGFDVVIDATGEDDVIQLLSNRLSSKSTHFISVSTGYNANRLYCYLATNSQFANIKNSFKERIDPFLQQDITIMHETSEIIEGIGCWHPLFPARIDDIQMLAGAAFKIIEQQLFRPKEERLVVIEKQYADGEFTGVMIKNI